MKQLQDIELKTHNKKYGKKLNHKYLIKATIQDGDEGTTISLRGNDLSQIIWWIEWKLSKELTDGEVNMDVQ